MKVLVVCLAFVAVCAAVDVEQKGLAADFLRDLEWMGFKMQYRKSYTTAVEEAKRKAIFGLNSEFVKNHNKQYAEGKWSFTLKVNHLADMTAEESAAMLNGYRPELKQPAPGGVFENTLTALPNSTDWRTKNVVTGVKNQGMCGSCWAFSTTGSLEGQHALQTKNLTSLSEQNLVDCSGKEGNEGCNGGLMDQAFNYILSNHGIDTEASYPYTGENDKCHFASNSIGATLKSYKDIASKNETDLTAAIASVGPISVAIDASSIFFQLYHSGVYYVPWCSQNALDHGVLAVGYGSSNGKDYYIVKNSWADTWGQKGYIWMARNRNNNCGIATQASYPIV